MSKQSGNISVLFYFTFNIPNEEDSNVIRGGLTFERKNRSSDLLKFGLEDNLLAGKCSVGLIMLLISVSHVYKPVKKFLIFHQS